MHTTAINGRMFVHHGDFSGEIEFNAVVDDDEHRELSGKTICVKVPFADLKGIVAEAVRRQLIAEAECKTPNELLGLKR